MKTKHERPWALGTAQELAQKGLGLEEIGAYFALGNDPQTGISGLVPNADLVRHSLGLTREKWNKILAKLVEAGLLIPSRDVQGLFLMPLMSSFACKNPNQYLHAYHSLQGLPAEIVMAWTRIYGDRVPGGVAQETITETITARVPETIPEPERGPKRKETEPGQQDMEGVVEGALMERARPKSEEPSPVKGLVASFVENWKAKNPGAPFSGGAALGKFLKSALRELEKAKAPDPPGMISRAIDAWFNPPPDLHNYAMSVSYGWEPFVRKYPELLRRLAYKERPTEITVRGLGESNLPWRESRPREITARRPDEVIVYGEQDEKDR